MSTEYFQNVLLIGATGDLGKYILNALLDLSTTHASQPINISLLTRSSSSSSSKFPSHPSIKNVFRGDISSHDFLEEAFKDQDIIISAISPYALLLQKNMLRVAAKVGVKKFILGEFGMDTKDVPLTNAVRVFQQNRAVLEHAEEICKAADMTFAGVICGTFLEMCLLDGEIGFEFESRTANLYDGGKKKFEASKMEDVGKATAELIFQPTNWVNELVYISTFTTSQKEILDALDKVDSKGPWKVIERETKWLKERGDKRVAEGDLYGLVDEIWAVAFSEGKGEAFSQNRNLANEKLAIPKNGWNNFEEVIRGVVGEWESGRRK
ncbi:hypothetical protein H072_10789 [Dactylellina haptotyla CBS 200.50]|uniref:NmrA-like domain-containing protein n=1 Tax=Dactylellina haptotyla (strain CBS 200.50) TaxID=1284197 RepID=S8B9V8_DACHA|nr:hypothetical protein H072_10789 [Dactylellina haptotyla CBS 200.50]